MARRAFKLPDIGEGVVEGEIVTWHVEVGSSVSEDDAIVDVMTDKSTVTIPSPYSGTIVSLNGDVGDMVAVGAVLVEFDSDEANVVDEAPVETEAGAKVEDEEPGAAPPKQTEDPVPAPEPRAPEPLPSQTPKSASNTVLASPAVRRRAREAGIDLANVAGSGRGGRIQQSDLDAAIVTGGSGPSPTRSVRKTGTRR